MNRREFLRTATALGAAGAAGSLGRLPTAEARLRGGSMLDLPAASAPIDTIVVCMMENRSFDHYLGWLGTDEAFLDEGRRRWGPGFRIDAGNDFAYARADGSVTETYPLLESSIDRPYRGCGHRDPGHSWNAGRAQRDGGFLAPGSNNDDFALGYFRAEDIPLYAALSRRFTTFDRHHCSVLGPTFPNREYLHSAQSGGLKNNALPNEVGYPSGFPWRTLWDQLAAAGVPARYYYVDLPVVGLWGVRLLSIASTIANYFEDAAAGRLPNVVFLDPGFLGETRSDEHPHGDVRDGQHLVWQLLKAFVDSPHWHRGAFLLTYDEWGGFFDHARLPHFRDDRASRDDAEDFRQGGFRVPTRLISPWARQNFVDHRLYDHASILRFLAWRFLGAPAKGKGRPGSSWYLTTRDRRAKNIGWSLLAENPDPDFDIDGLDDPTTSPPCSQPAVAAAARAPAEPHDLARGLEWFADLGYEIGSWLPGR